MKRLIPILLTMICVSCLFAQASVKPIAITLMRSGNLPSAISRHGSCVVNNRLYCVGGYDDTQRVDTVYSAEILKDAKLGFWRMETQLPQPRAEIQTGLVAIGNRIFVLGGSILPAERKDSKPLLSDEIHSAIVKADGTLGEWGKSGDMPVAQLCGFVAAAQDNRIFIIGGRGGSTTDVIMASEVSSEGTFSKWVDAGKIPLPLAFHAAAIINDRMYIWGGVSGVNARHNLIVWSSPIDDGKVSNWVEETPMPEASYEAICIGWNDCLLSIGGRDKNSQGNNGMWLTRIVNGKIGPWYKLSSDLTSYLYMSAAVDASRGWVFVSGGKVKQIAGTSASATAAKSRYLCVKSVQSFQIGGQKK